MARGRKKNEVKNEPKIKKVEKIEPVYKEAIVPVNKTLPENSNSIFTTEVIMQGNATVYTTQTEQPKEYVKNNRYKVDSTMYRQLIPQALKVDSKEGQEYINKMMKTKSMTNTGSNITR